MGITRGTVMDKVKIVIITIMDLVISVIKILSIIVNITMTKIIIIHIFGHTISQMCSKIDFFYGFIAEIQTICRKKIWMERRGEMCNMFC